MRGIGGPARQISRLGSFKPGRHWYLYVGSAFGPGGLAARVGRHLRENKTQHWHLDYLLPATCVREVWFHTGRRDLEHVWAESMLNYPASAIPLEKLGASDCNCRSHFVRLPTLRETHDLKCLLKGKGPVICHRPVF